MGESKIVWLADASDRLRALHIEIDASVRRLAWGEEFDHEHIAALLAANRIASKVISYVTERSERRAYIRSSQSQQRRVEALQRMASRNRESRIDRVVSQKTKID